jgi:maleylacetate reductase
VSGDFVWRDAGRTVVFGAPGLAAAPELFGQHGFASFDLLSTPRALAQSPELAAAAGAVHEVPPGQVPALAASLLDVVEVGSSMRDKAQPQAFVALGGGRVIDTAKAIAAVSGTPVAAIPTTMSGAEMTAIHRLPTGAERRLRGMVRPALVLADPELMTGAPEPELRASSMNALAHGADSICTPLSNPVSELTALRGAELIASSLDRDRGERDRAALALGSLLCGYAIDSAGFGLHHVACQTLVRICGTPHAGTNAAVLPHVVAYLAAQAPAPFARFASALGTDLDGLEARIRRLGGDPPGLGDLGADRAKLDEAIAAMLQRPELGHVPRPPSREELAELLAAAW